MVSLVNVDRIEMMGPSKKGIIIKHLCCLIKWSEKAKHSIKAVKCGIEKTRFCRQWYRKHMMDRF